MAEIKSMLNLNKLVFDFIEFHRKGYKNTNDLKYKFEVTTGKSDDFYKVTLVLTGSKEEEYDFKISLTGIFKFDADKELDEEIKQTIISKNTVAILMPYMRSQVSLLTAQPEVDCVILQPFNINKIFDNSDNRLKKS